MKSVTLKAMGILILAIILPNSATSEDFSPDTIRKTWEKRIENLSAIDVTFKTSHVDIVTEDMEDSSRDISLKALPRTLSYQTSSRIMVDGRLIRFEHRGTRPNADMQLRESNFVSSYDLSRSSSLFEPNTETSYPVGFISDESNCSDALTLENVPILFFCYLLALPEYGIDLDKMTIKAREMKIDGISCVVVSQAERAGLSSYELWLDPNADFSIRRIRFLAGTKCMSQIDCVYTLKSGFSVPQEWTCTRFLHDGSLLTSAKSTVVKMLVGQKFNKDDFSITFPVGTVVSDSRNPELAERDGTHDYILLEGGKKLPILWNEPNITYEELLHRNSQNSKKPLTATTVLIAVNVLVVIILIVYLFVRRRM